MFTAERSTKTTLLSHKEIVHHYSYVYHTGAALKRCLAKNVYPCWNVGRILLFGRLLCL